MFLAYSATPEDLAINALVKRALSRLGLLVKQAAFLMGCAEKYLDDALAGRRPLRFQKLHVIEGFAEAYLEALADECGYDTYARHRVKLILMVDSTPRPMLRVVEPPAAERKRA